MTWIKHELGAVTVEQAGAWGTPTHWRIKRNGQLIGTADNEADALTMGCSFAAHGTDEWIALRKLAASMVGMGRPERRKAA